MDIYSMNAQDLLYYYVYIPAAAHYSVETTVRLINDLTEKHLASYVWHYERFHVVCKGEIIKGTVNLGQASGGLDEWVIVSIFYQATLLQPLLAVRLSDSDGEFLLIEGANHLPSWLDPEIAKYRAWIRNGNVLLCCESPLRELTLDEAIAFIGSGRGTIVHEVLTRDIKKKISGLPEIAVQSCRHVASVQLQSSRLAWLLHHRPELISFIVHAFYNRSPSQIRQASRFSNLKPDRTICTNVCFSKALFAMIACGTEWKEEDIARTLGLKLAIGMEILLMCDNYLAKEAVEQASSVSQLVANSWIEQNWTLDPIDYLSVMIKDSQIKESSEATNLDLPLLEDMVAQVKHMIDDDNDSKDTMISSEYEVDDNDREAKITFDAKEFWFKVAGSKQ